ncbi:hypothetical protein MF672_032235 [Actinomadura sp. ATCC 31491]|uniref:Uncharacterized protein n=1 Tax=Actinomadura luzonensis TaxID=2805427 RepID=A0ABT0G2L8_9ACTN|nr:hypothetical protein [Actinomadura luzonensis]MCK2218430.1 hypothetical protein [Actinomadura luzonensis]
MPGAQAPAREVGGGGRYLFALSVVRSVLLTPLVSPATDDTALIGGETDGVGHLPGEPVDAVRGEVACSTWSGRSTRP